MIGSRSWRMVSRVAAAAALMTAGPTLSHSADAPFRASEIVEQRLKAVQDVITHEQSLTFAVTADREFDGVVNDGAVLLSHRPWHR